MLLMCEASCSCCILLRACLVSAAHKHRSLQRQPQPRRQVPGERHRSHVSMASAAGTARCASARASRVNEARASLESLIDLGVTPQQLRTRAGRRSSIVKARGAWRGRAGGRGGCSCEEAD